MKYAVIAAPRHEPIALKDAKLYLRTLPDDDTEDAAIIEPLIAAAREYCENTTGRTLAVQKIEAYPEEFSWRIDLPHAPINSIEKVMYIDAEGVEHILSETMYIADPSESIIIMRELPQFRPYPVKPIRITYTAGYCPRKLPKTIRQAMLLLIGHWYTNRETVVVGAIASVEVQLTTKRLLDQWKAWWF